MKKMCYMCCSLSRRIKRWIQEKQQRERIATIRRQRHKSLGDVETVSKSKQRQQQQSLFHHFSTCPPQVDIMSYSFYMCQSYKKRLIWSILVSKIFIILQILVGIIKKNFRDSRIRRAIQNVTLAFNLSC